MAKKYLTVREIADKYILDYRTVWNWIREGKLKAIKVKGRLRIEQSSLDKLIER